jgi:tetratricopeptide (TPR) repeat protein
MRRILLAPGAALVAALAVSAGACGGETPKAKNAATTTTGDAGAVVSAPVVNTKGQQVAVSSPPADSELTGDAKSAYDRGFQAWTAGDLQTAKTAFADAASRAPRAASPRYSLGCVQERLGDISGALDSYRNAYGTNSKFEFAAGAYALLQARSGHGTDAEQFLASKQAQNPDSVRLLTYLAEVKSIEGDSPGCQQLAQQALAKQPDFKDAMVVIARDYYRSHRWDLAKYALQAILDGADDGSIPPRDKGNADALLLRALIERESGDRKHALTDFDQAVARRPDLFEAYINVGEMKLEAGNATEAAAPLQRAVRYAPNVAIAHLDLGDCYRLLGRPGDAKGEFDRALGMDSTLAGAHYNLGLLYLFSTGTVPGVSSQDDQLAKAIQELETYKSMRGARATKGPGDDVDELLSTAKRKQSELQFKKQAAAQSSAAPAAPAPAGSSKPATAPTPAGSTKPASAPPPSGSAASTAPKPGSAPATAPKPAPAPAASGGNIVRELPK